MSALTLVEWMAVLLLGGVVLLVLELFLPTHGVLGVMGGLAITGGIGVAFGVGLYVGAAVTLGAMIAAPFAWGAGMRIWPRTPIGRALTLPPVPMAPVGEVPVAVGVVGRAVSDLRPTGVCEFEGRRMEARSDAGIVGAGASVRVVATEGAAAAPRPVVRQV